MFRAPEMIDIYNGQPITIKADIWVSFYLHQLQLQKATRREIFDTYTNILYIPDNNEQNYSFCRLKLLDANS